MTEISFPAARRAFLSGFSLKTVRRFLATWRLARGIADDAQGEFALAFRHFLAAARAGLPEAQFRVAPFYIRNDVVCRNPADALYWYRRAAEQGHAEAEFELGLLYLYGQSGRYGAWFRNARSENEFAALSNRDILFPNGLDVPFDFTEALHWLKRAAARGRVEAQANVGLLHLHGQEQPDYSEAFRWLSVAAEGGNAEAQHGLAILYVNGLGRQRDVAKAIEWYERAAIQGNQSAQSALGYLYAFGGDVDHDFDRAALCLYEASIQGNAQAAFHLGLLHADNSWSGYDMAKAALCFQRAARRGHVPAMLNLAQIHRDGLVGDAASEKAAMWYRIAADAGDPEGQFQLGTLYATGDGVVADRAEAARLYRLAAEQGHAFAQHNLAEALLDGTGVVQDESEAARWYLAAAEQGLGESEAALGELHSTGRGVERDPNLARQYYERAAANGNTAAGTQLASPVEISAEQADSHVTQLIDGDGSTHEEPHPEPAAQAVEPVRLVIWDLDDTFWKGTLCEGGIEAYIQENHDLVVTLAHRGIVSSICSKNNKDEVRRILLDRGLWDYFVFPSIDWTAKADRLADIIERTQFRAQSVLFLDNDAANRAEAKSLLPELQVAETQFIPEMLEDWRLQGKPDTDLSRLAHYKLLETRDAARSASRRDNEAFLWSSDIRVYIDSDVANNLDRAIELIKRTKQLNFSKRSLPANIDCARKQVMDEISPAYVRSGLIRVVDKFGDYGYCGFYRMIDTMLLDYCFSCRIIGLGVERWLYDRLNRPPLEVVGEVVSDLSQTQPVEWITPLLDGDAEEEHFEPDFPEVRLRGGCVVEGLAHYFRFFAETVRVDVNRNRPPLVFHADSSAQLSLSFGEQPMRIYRAIRQLGFADEDFEDDFLAHVSAGSILVYAGWADISLPVYRHKREKFTIPVDVDVYKDLTQITDHELSDELERSEFDTIRKGRIREIASTLRSDYDYEALLPVDEAALRMRELFERLPPDVPLFVILPHECVKWNNTMVCRAAVLQYNKAVREVANGYPQVTVIAMSEVASEPDDFQPDFDMFNRLTYYRLFRKIAHHASALSTGRATNAKSLS